ncbi:MAG: hypothetical protein HY319_32655 [Armatimonadetes bacterium]|nr:hypothetical protein [Armatimonadota bacterium]
MNRWQLTTLVLASLWVGAFFASRLVFGPAAAAPADVFGSPDVAVTGFQTTGGTFVLWSDGHITNVPTDGSAPTVVNGADAYKLPAAGTQTRPAPTAGKPQGSPNVAVGVLPTRSVTYVLFADGTAKIPLDDDAKKGPPASGRVESGVYYGSVGGQDAFYSTSGTALVPTSGVMSTTYVLQFDPPFDSAPIVCVQALTPPSLTPPTEPGEPYAVGSYKLKTPQDLSVTSVSKNSVTIKAAVPMSHPFLFTAVEPGDVNDIIREY